MRGEKSTKRKAAKAVIAVFLALVVVGFVVGSLMVMGQVRDSRGLERDTRMQLNSRHLVDDQGGSAPGGGLGYVPRAGEILPVSDSWILTGIHIEKGYINIYADIPEPLPIYVDNTVVGAWNVTYEVYGGYQPTTGYFVDVIQSGVVHQIPYSLVLVRQDSSGAMIYQAVFSTEPFYLNSDQYPLVTLVGTPGESAGHGYVPGTNVTLSSTETWASGADPVQTFPVMSARTARSLGDIAPIPHPLPPIT